MSPLQIEILLWYYARANDYRDGDFSAPAVREAVDDFRGAAGMLAPTNDLPSGQVALRAYRLTDRGQAYVDALMAMPLPVCRWEIPKQDAA